MAPIKVKTHKINKETCEEFLINKIIQNDYQINNSMIKIAKNKCSKFPNLHMVSKKVFIKNLHSIFISFDTITMKPKLEKIRAFINEKSFQGVFIAQVVTGNILIIWGEDNILLYEALTTALKTI
jgi:hypothetical protein